MSYNPNGASPKRITSFRPVMERPVTPQSERLIITVGTGKSQALLAVTLPAMRDYAARVGADFIALTNPTQDWPLAEKFRVSRFASQWLRTLYLDADVFVRSTAPDIFDAVPVAHVGMLDDMPALLTGSGVDWLDREMVELAESQGTIAAPTAICLNSGVVVCDFLSAEIWGPPDAPFPVRHCMEQNIVQTRALQHPIHYLPEKWNYQYWRNRDFAGVENAHFVHLSGMSQAAPDLMLPVLRALALTP
jgi:hypothetical protein